VNSFCEYGYELSDFIKNEIFIDQSGDISISRRTLLDGVSSHKNMDLLFRVGIAQSV
jgi:hypothetical protein